GRDKDVDRERPQPRRMSGTGLDVRDGPPKAERLQQVETFGADQQHIEGHLRRPPRSEKPPYVAGGKRKIDDDQHAYEAPPPPQAGARLPVGWREPCIAFGTQLNIHTLASWCCVCDARLRLAERSWTSASTRSSEGSSANVNAPRTKTRGAAISAVIEASPAVMTVAPRASRRTRSPRLSGA